MGIKCLVQALVGACWCRLYGIPYVVHLGVRKDEAEGMKAHAWLCTGKLVFLAEKDTVLYDCFNFLAFIA